MASYVHICEGCGAQMMVHERYLGRTLRCTSCRSEFVAEAPIESVVEESVVEEKPSSSPRRWKRVFIVLAFLVPVTAFLWWLGQDQSAGVAQSAFRAQRSVGDLGDLDTGSGELVPTALDYDSLVELVKAVDSEDEAKVQAFLETGTYVQVEAGTRVRVLELRREMSEAKVRIIEGPWTSRIVWVSASWIR